MSALSATHLVPLAALGLALLVGALIARRSPRDEGRRDHVVMDDRIRARLEALIWPD